jgi:uncharacterized membrane protein
MKYKTRMISIDYSKQDYKQVKQGTAVKMQLQ